MQALLADKESQLVEVEAASSGELVRLGALLEAARGDSARLTLEHKKQQEEWELAVTQLKSKLEASEELQIQLAASAAKTRSNNMFSFFVFPPLFYSFLSMFIFSTQL
jgi:hypothetical protein